MVFEQEVNIFTGNTEKALRQAETEIVQLSDAISMKASATDVYTKQQTEAILEVKANKDTLISEINASADQMKIQADRINITGVVTIGKLATQDDIPTAVSDLDNDSGFVTSDSVPTKVSQLENDSAYATGDQIPTNVSDLSNDLDFATTGDIPTKVSQLQNDKSFQTATEVNNTIIGKGYATTTEAQDYASAAETNAKNAIPTNLSDFQNDSGYQTSTEVSDAITDGVSGKADKNEIPTQISDLNNDSMYQTAEDVSKASQSTLETAAQDATDKANEAAKTATDNITRIDTTGVWMTPSSMTPTDPQSGAGATGTKADSKGVHIYNNGTEMASYGDEAVVGREDSFHTVTDDSGMAIFNGAKKISSFGRDGITLGAEDSGIRNVMTNTRQAFQTDSGDIAWFGLNDEGIWEMHIDVTYAEDMIRFGNFAWIKRANGNMTIKWIGE